MYRDGFYVFRCQSRCVLYGATRVHSGRALSTWIELVEKLECELFSMERRIVNLGSKASIGVVHR